MIDEAVVGDKKPSDDENDIEFMYPASAVFEAIDNFLSNEKAKKTTEKYILLVLRVWFYVLVATGVYAFIIPGGFEVVIYFIAFSFLVPIGTMLFFVLLGVLVSAFFAKKDYIRLFAQLALNAILNTVLVIDVVDDNLYFLTLSRSTEATFFTVASVAIIAGSLFLAFWLPETRYCKKAVRVTTILFPLLTVGLIFELSLPDKNYYPLENFRRGNCGSEVVSSGSGPSRVNFCDYWFEVNGKNYFFNEYPGDDPNNIFTKGKEYTHLEIRSGLWNHYQLVTLP
ncbi:hypothetical protein H0A36_24540 [Endozoicomonas sp. SM1973]|uniref:Uncharacterized protein n=1 Tax=Spartinivicinus marinus TaxID=2994442 RepID=A0A853I797_9GAMM|nr:hypothetical protein [Spartinivicinus marinus]MCX4024913.1 hypothetical protein [Spartinivicinus marinus]NYZ69193.1 hypothetical protein [Spartinivicinus marinus]